MSIWKYLLAGGVGFGVAKLIGGSKKTQSEPSSSSSNKSNKSNTSSSDWKEEVRGYIDKKGVYDAFDYIDYTEIKSKPFQTAWTNYKKDLKTFESIINKLPKNQKIYVNQVINKEGFDYAFDAYSNFDELYIYDNQGNFTKEIKFTNAEFHKGRKQYLKSYKALLRVVNR